MAQRFFLGRDNDAHWYIIEADKRDEWDAWCGLDPDDDASWHVPEFAKEIGGSPTQISFEDPRNDLYG